MAEMQENHLIINNVPTRVLTWGKTMYDDFSRDDKLIVMIPGNPGLTKFYLEFLQELHDATNISIWILSHAGHEIIESQEMPSRKGKRELFSLEGQVRHKEIFIEDYVLPKRVKFYLIGHSIGSYIVLELLKTASIRSNVLHNYLLFPTIEHMAESPNGMFIMNYLRHIKFILLSLVYIIYILPNFIKIFLLQVYFKLTNIPNNFCDVMLDFLHPYTVQNFSDMGLDEMHKVRERNNDMLKENLATVKLYYGQTDCWVPVSYYRKIKDDIPGIDAELCSSGYKHAFVLHDSKAMAHLVANWIRNS